MEVEVDAKEAYFLFRDLLELLSWTVSVNAITSSVTTVGDSEESSVISLHELDELSLDSLSFFKAVWSSSTRGSVVLLTHWLKALCEPNLLNDFAGSRQN